MYIQTIGFCNNSLLHVLDRFYLKLIKSCSPYISIRIEYKCDYKLIDELKTFH